jgi:hypothetical protein
MQRPTIPGVSLAVIHRKDDSPCVGRALHAKNASAMYRGERFAAGTFKVQKLKAIQPAAFRIKCWVKEEGSYTACDAIDLVAVGKYGRPKPDISCATDMQNSAS